MSVAKCSHPMSPRNEGSAPRLSPRLLRRAPGDAAARRWPPSLSSPIHEPRQASGRNPGCARSGERPAAKEAASATPLQRGRVALLFRRGQRLSSGQISRFRAMPLLSGDAWGSARDGAHTCAADESALLRFATAARLSETISLRTEAPAQTSESTAQKSESLFRGFESVLRNLRCVERRCS